MKRMTFPNLALPAVCLGLQFIMAVSAFAQPLNFEVIVGKWTRTDGNYTIHVRDIKSDGSADIGYFNPGTINVAESHVAGQDGLVKLFVKLQDRGYPGSTYTLYYYAEKEALVGYYYQAAMDRTFEVIFLREKAE
ncbi:MAG: hypothetical protein HKP58_00290 [Desulfatitalea sp.]|nr:hypothetical protein [Desulfatitalea sp.]NNJ98828.1 hypothetical protein [Desulfatitalea sp.]